MKMYGDFFYELKGNYIVVASNGFVNNSGEILKKAMYKFGIEKEDAVYVYDEFQIELGKIRIAKKGSSGGHKGLESVISIFGEGISRIKIGIGFKPKGVDPKDFVLSKFLADEVKKLEDVKKLLLDVVECIADSGIDKAMSLYNRL